MMRKLLWLAFLIALLAVVLNDGGRWFNAKSDLSQATSQLGSWATANLGTGTDLATATQRISQQAAEQKVTLFKYQQDANGFVIETQTNVRGTWILGPYVAVLKGVPFKKSFDTPMVINDSVQAQFH